MAIFGKPDFEKMRENDDWPTLVHYATYTKDPATSREAARVATRDVPRLVEYLYDTVVWTQRNSAKHGAKLPRRGIRQIEDASLLLRQIGSRAVAPLVDSLRLYDEFGDPDDRVETLYCLVVLDVLEKMGAKSVEGLRDLARVKDETVRVPARETLQRLVDRGVVESTGLGQGRSARGS